MQIKSVTGHLGVQLCVIGCVYDDDCFDYHSWRNHVVIAFGSLSSYWCTRVHAFVRTCMYNLHDLEYIRQN